jgi:outer membrane protein OmpA-like peptidoglycan-associated protein
MVSWVVGLKKREGIMLNGGRCREKALAAAVLALIGMAGASILMAQELPKEAWNLGRQVNSKYSDFGPIISADGNALYFTSDREGTYGGQDIWVSRRVGGNWTEPISLGRPVNTENNEGPDTFSVDEQIMYLTCCNREDGLGQCDICMSRRVGENEWSEVENLGGPLNSKYNDANASLSLDGKTLYFVSTRPTGLGGYDIWVSHQDDRGNWSKPENMGPTINTPMNEVYAFIHTDGISLYFSSDGHGGLGGPDIFRSQLGPEGWGEPVNLGPLVNTPDKDYYFTIPAAGDLAYFSSDRGNTMGQEDLYAVPVPLVVQPKGVTLVRGIVANIDTCAPPTRHPKTGVDVYDITTCTPVQANLRIADIMTDKEFYRVQTRSDGFYQTFLPAGKSYSISAFAKGFAFHSERFDVPPESGYKVIEKNILLHPEEVGRIVVLNNIFFDFDKSTLRPESKGELNNLTNMMKQNPTMRIEIRGHTDSKGSNKYNITLSKNRAKSVVEYLIGMGGVEPRRLEAYGYGEEVPIASNATDEGRQLNRRVEFKILEK